MDWRDSDFSDSSNQLMIATFKVLSNQQAMPVETTEHTGDLRTLAIIQQDEALTFNVTLDKHTNQ